MAKNPNEVKINHVNRLYYVNGKPFIQYAIHYGANLTMEPDYARKILTAFGKRYTAIIFDRPSLGEKPAMSLANIMAIARECNIKVILWMGSFMEMTPEEIETKARDQILAVRDCPAFLGWSGLTDEQRADPKLYQTLCSKIKIIKKLDPYHPVFAQNDWPSFGSWKSVGGDPCDILEYHWYSFGMKPFADGPETWITGAIDAGRTARESFKPVSAMPQTSGPFPLVVPRTFGRGGQHLYLYRYGPWRHTL